MVFPTTRISSRHSISSTELYRSIRGIKDVFAERKKSGRGVMVLKEIPTDIERRALQLV